MHKYLCEYIHTYIYILILSETLKQAAVEERLALEAARKGAAAAAAEAQRVAAAAAAEAQRAAEAARRRYEDEAPAREAARLAAEEARLLTYNLLLTYLRT